MKLGAKMWNDVKVIESSDKNVLKYVFSNENAVAESVLYKYPTYEERTVICCSTQSGCPVGCRFCGAGDYFVRSLTTAEIISQPNKLLEDTQVHPCRMKRLQIMFMSMGEPLLNLPNLIPALIYLYDEYPNAALLISTIGPRIGDSKWNELFNICRLIPTIGLQFSIHETTDEKRDKLIPFEAKHSLKELALLGKLFWKYSGRQPFFNYCVHDQNNTKEDVDRLTILFDPNIFQATISVICERDEHVAAANERQRKLAEDFRDELRSRGFQTRVFDPAGQDDTGSGCGQLWWVQNWMRENPDKARKSVGYGLPILHTPVEAI